MIEILIAGAMQRIDVGWACHEGLFLACNVHIVTTLPRASREAHDRQLACPPMGRMYLLRIQDAMDLDCSAPQRATAAGGSG